MLLACAQKIDLPWEEKTEKETGTPRALVEAKSTPPKRKKNIKHTHTGAVQHLFERISNQAIIQQLEADIFPTSSYSRAAEPQKIRTYSRRDRETPNAWWRNNESSAATSPVRRRVRAFADRERDDHPHLIPNLEPNLSKVPFVSTTSLNSGSVSLMFRTWDHFGPENVLYETNPSYIRQRRAATRLPNRRVARILWWLYNEKELVPGFLGGWVRSPLFSKGGAYKCRYL
jgi:hypothetical protein